jgi:DNA-directed RNA polymerase specialized sigma24 family protein
MKSSLRKGQTRDYASNTDFCEVFNQHLDSLYRLALVLTADEEQAEQSFVASVEDCFRSRDVFRDWACAWSRRALIQNAIRLLKPYPPQSESRQFAKPPKQSTIAIRNDAILALDGILSLELFRRFVFVMSVLERYSDHECALLLGCSVKEVREARIGALRDLPDSYCANTGAHEWAHARRRVATPHQIAHQGAHQ